ncbi:hypothetical protein [Negadavirga shengliensis]|uniref:Uncharacterized protein n=1 Tax=Negadavirga shengliensis TaxID=1389218 RepID=A0ABV9SY52_9BACT
MFKLFSASKSFPQIKYVNLRDIQMYMRKFEESIRNLEEMQKDSI